MSYNKTRKSYNDSTLSIRLPAQVLDHFSKLSEAHFKTPSEMTRQLIVDYIKNAGILAVAQTPHTAKSNAPQRPSNQTDLPEWADPTDEWLS